MADYPVLDGAGAEIIATEKDPALSGGDVVQDLGSIDTWTATASTLSGNVLTADADPSGGNVTVKIRRSGLDVPAPGSYVLKFDIDAVTNLSPRESVNVALFSMDTPTSPLRCNFDFADGGTASESYGRMTSKAGGGYTCEMDFTVIADGTGLLDMGPNETVHDTVQRLVAPAGDESITLTNLRIETPYVSTSYDYSGDYPVLDGAGAEIIATARDPALDEDEGPVSLIENGTFDTDILPFTQSGTVWQWGAGGVAEASSSRGGGGALFLSQDMSGKLVAGQSYDISIDITARTSGSVFVRIRGATNASTDPFNTTGTHTWTLVCPASPVDIVIIGNSSVEMSVDNFTLVASA